MSGLSKITKVAMRAAPKAAITVTPNAASRIKFLCDNHTPPTKGIRLGVRTRGCNGMSYTMNFADTPQGKFDEIVKIPDSEVNLFIDAKALLTVIGTTMDYVETDLTAEFTFNNPNSKGSCGCGESFTV